MPRSPSATLALEVRHRDGRRLRFWESRSRAALLKVELEVHKFGLPDFAHRDLECITGLASVFNTLDEEPLWSPDTRALDIFGAYVGDVTRWSSSSGEPA